MKDLFEKENYEVKNFFGKDIICAWVDKKCYIYLKPIVEDLGLQWHRQRQKIIDGERWTHKRLPIETNSGRQEGIFLDAEDFFGWVYNISPQRIKASRKKDLIQYQKKITPALANYMIHGYAIDHERAKEDPQIYTNIQNEIIATGGGVKFLSHAEKKIKESFSKNTTDYNDNKKKVTEFCITLSSRIMQTAIEQRAADLKVTRCSSKKPLCGLVQTRKVNTSTVQVAKNYLSDWEVSLCKVICNSLYTHAQFLEAKNKKISTSELIERYNKSLDNFGFRNEGECEKSINKEAKRHVKEEYNTYKSLPVKPEQKGQLTMFI